MRPAKMNTIRLTTQFIAGMSFFVLFSVSNASACTETKPPSRSGAGRELYLQAHVGEKCSISLSTKNQVNDWVANVEISYVKAETDINVELKHPDKNTYVITYQANSIGQHSFFYSASITPKDSGRPFTDLTTYNVTVVGGSAPPKANQNNTTQPQKSEANKSNTQYSNYSNSVLCRQTLNSKGDAFETSSNYSEQLNEIKKRHLSPEDCRSLLRP